MSTKRPDRPYVKMPEPDPAPTTVTIIDRDGKATVMTVLEAKSRTWRSL